MKWSPRDAIARHAGEVLADPRTKPEDAAAARRAIADPFGPEALDGLSLEDLEEMRAELVAKLALDDAHRCISCRAPCAACAAQLED